MLLERYPALLNARYKIDVADMDAVDVVQGIAKRRGYLLKGNIADTEKAALAFLVDYRSGALGRISLETPESRQQMIENSRPMKIDKSQAADEPADSDYLD